MLLLLPPSEGKTSPPRGRPVDLARLSWPDQLGPTRRRVLAALVTLCSADARRASEVLGLSGGLSHEVQRNAGLLQAPAAAARDVYSGVLFQALGLESLDAAAKSRATRTVRIVSALWGAVSPADRIPAYRLSMAVALPGVGALAAAWRAPLAITMPAAVGPGLLVDLRSSTYAGAWRPAGALAARTVAVGAVRDRAGARSVVSHLAKHHRGQVARHLLVTGDAPRRPAELAESLRTRWEVDLVAPSRPGNVWHLDVVLRE